MSLKKSDKIIAIIGVLILVIAGIAIAYYAYNTEEVGKTTEPTNKIYKITWKEGNGEMKLTDLNVLKNEPFTQTFTVSADKQNEPGSVLTSVSVKVVWEDHNTFGLIKKKGLDTLTVKVTCEGGETKTYEGTGSGNETLAAYSINSMPDVKEVEAMTISEAEQDIYENNSAMNSAVFNIESTVKIGEPNWRFLKANKDKGNDFSLFITYTYYYPEIIGDENNNNDEPPTENNPYTDLSIIYHNMCKKPW